MWSSIGNFYCTIASKTSKSIWLHTLFVKIEAWTSPKWQKEIKRLMRRVTWYLVLLPCSFTCWCHVAWACNTFPIYIVEASWRLMYIYFSNFTQQFREHFLSNITDSKGYVIWILTSNTIMVSKFDFSVYFKVKYLFFVGCL